MKALKRIWFGGLMIAATLFIIMPVGIGCVIVQSVCLCLVKIIDMLTLKDAHCDHYQTPFEGVKDDIELLKKYSQSILGSIMHFVNE